jgi:hypothetical protein
MTMIATKNVPVNLSISLFIWASESMAVEEDNLAFNLEIRVLILNLELLVLELEMR